MGDELLSVNDMSTDGLTADDVSDMINAVSGQVKLKVRTPPDTRSYHNRALEVSHDDNDGGEMNGHDSADVSFARDVSNKWFFLSYFIFSDISFSQKSINPILAEVSVIFI